MKAAVWALMRDYSRLLARALSNAAGRSRMSAAEIERFLFKFKLTITRLADSLRAEARVRRDA
jgi:hypothetical protein